MEGNRNQLLVWLNRNVIMIMVTPQSTHLISCHIIEKDCNGDILWVWSYPKFDPVDREVFMRKCKFFYEYGNRQKLFRFFRYNGQWVYIHSSEVFSSDGLPKVKLVSLMLSSLDFNPERYETLCRVLTKSYCKSGHPPVMLQLFLSVLVTGKCTTEENGTFFANEFNTSCPYRQHQLNAIISRFGLETILIYTGLLLKRRIVVYHHDVDSLIEFVLSLPAFLTHRDMWDSVFPWVDLYEDELSDFKDSKFHIIGCANAGVENHVDLYDVFVNVPASEISVASHAKESMTMTKTHKDIALFMVQLTEKESLTERDIMQEISRKTKDLIDHLRSVGSEVDGRVVVSLDQLKKKEYSSQLEAFLFSLAQVENLAVI
ncbi:unnamed protein product [Allacma fusca]|uniref:UDENN domain-containing protein n=1 Tax=Allacma fusca TaxID=39272 RepID=A0A8J2L7H7_9HEXA|nr:unnamed protein product [Allacma fusca]